MSGEPLSSPYVFRGIEYTVSMEVHSASPSVTVEVEDRATADQWRATFDASYIEDLTHKTGNFKQFSIFANMLESAIIQNSDSVSLDLLTYGDLESLRQRKSGSQMKPSVTTTKASLNSKRYLILTYTVEFDRIHYPLPLPYMGKPDPRELQKLVRQLKMEIKQLKEQRHVDCKMEDLEKLQREYSELYKEKSKVEAEFVSFCKEMKNTNTSQPVKEIKMLKSVVRNLEEDLLKEKMRNQRASSRRGQEYRDLLEEVEELRLSERSLRIRVKNLTSELAIYTRNRSKRQSRPVSRDYCSSSERLKASSRNRSSSYERSMSRERASSRNRTYSRRPVSAPDTSQLSSTSRGSSKHRYKIARSRLPSPPVSRFRFDPTAYVKEREQKMRDSKSKHQRKINMARSGSAERRSNPSAGSRNSSQRSAHSWNMLKFSYGSQGDSSDGDLSDASYRPRNYKRSSQQKRDVHRFSRPAQPQLQSNRHGLSKKIFPTTPEERKKKKDLIDKGKESYPDSVDENGYYDHSSEISEIDARLNRLQHLLNVSMT